MHLIDIKITNFRNYEFQALAFSPRLNLITGLNGMGKTNLLDAIYYMCMGKSHFSGTDRSVVRKGETFFRLEGNFQRQDHKEKITVKVQPGKSKSVERNRNPYPRLSDHVGFLPVVFQSPDDTTLALEGSEERRRFIDNTISQLDSHYLNELIHYNKLLLARNALLKQFAGEIPFNPTLLEVYNEKMYGPSLYIFQKREEFIGVFEPVFNTYYKNICQDIENVSVVFRSQLQQQSLLDLLTSNLEKDRVLQRTSAGIHKDDLQFEMKGMPLKRFASQGQLKSFILALKLSQYEILKKAKQMHPILLLDDLFDKLDENRIGSLMEMLVSNDFGQVFISDTHPERCEEFAKHFGGDYEKFIIADGKSLPA